MEQATVGTEQRLSRAAFFAFVSRELFRKGSLTQTENVLLQRLTQFLKLAPETAVGLARAARQRALSRGADPSRAVTVGVVYVRVLQRVLAVGAPDPRALQMMEAFRVLAGLPEGTHERALAQLRARETAERHPESARSAAPAQAAPRSSLEHLASLAHDGQIVKAQAILADWIGARGSSEGFAKLYQASLDACLQAAVSSDVLDRVVDVVKMAHRLAAMPPQQPLRWRAFCELVESAADALARAGRWELHAEAVALFSEVPQASMDQIAVIQARTLVTAVELNLKQGRSEEAFKLNSTLGQMELSVSNQGMRPARAKALAATVEILSNRDDADPARLTQARKALLQLIRAHPTDRDVARALISCLEPCVLRLMKMHDVAALQELMTDIELLARNNQKDETMALPVARELVNAAIWWKEARQRELEGRNILARFLKSCRNQGDSVLDALRGALQAIVMSCPYSDKVGDARRRFEGLTGYKLRCTVTERAPTGLPRLALKPAH